MVDKVIDDFIVSEMQEGISQYLRRNPQDSLRNVAVEMASQGYNVVCAGDIICFKMV